MATTSFPKKLALKWAYHSGLAVTDQVSVAVANFLMNVAFARWGPAREYASFALVQSLFLFSAVVYTALFTEPMMVFVHREFSNRRHAYYLRLLQVQVVFTTASIFVFSVSGLTCSVEGYGEIGNALVGFGFAGPSLLAFGLLRRIYYCEGRPRKSAMAGIAFFALSIGSIYVLVTTHLMNSICALIATAICALVPTFYLLVELIWTPSRKSAALPSLNELARLHWSYSRWSLPSGIAGWFPTNIGSIFLPLWVGLEAVATFRALSNLILPVSHIIIAVSSLAMPALARQHANKNFWHYCYVFVVVMAAFGIGYCVMLAVIGPWLSDTLYAGRFSENGALIATFALSCIPQPIISAANSILRARALPRPIFNGTAAGAIVAIGAGIPLTMRFGIIGAAGAMALSLLANAVLALWSVMLVLIDDLRAGKITTATFSWRLI